MMRGFCECRSVQFEVDGEINDYSHCHCSQCRRLHGAAYATFAGVARNQFRYVSGQDVIRSYSSSESHDRIFCGKCGSNILVDYKPEIDMLYLCMGTLDDNPPHPTGYHQFVGSKAPWHEITDGLEQYDIGPPD